MPCRILINSDSFTSNGEASPKPVGVVVAVMPIDHIWGTAEQTPNFVSVELDCSEQEAADAFFELEFVEDEIGGPVPQRKYVVDFDDFTNNGRTRVIEDANYSIGAGSRIRWSELRRAMTAGSGDRPTIPSLSAQENQPARARGTGDDFATEMIAKKGNNTHTPGSRGGGGRDRARPAKDLLGRG